MTVHIVAGRRTKEDGRARNVTTLSPSARRNPFENLPAALRIVPQRRRIVSDHVAGRDGINVDTLCRPFVGKGPRELGDSTLRCGISRNENASLKREQGSNVHDLAPPPLLQHLLTGELRQPEHSRKVHSNKLVPIALRELSRRRPPDHACIVHQDVN